MDTATQVVVSVGVPTMAVLVRILINNSRLSDLRSHIDTRFDLLQKHVEGREA
jgi:hypothetical protein